MNIIEKIEIIMKEKGITRYQIEKNLGIKQSTFKNWINGTEPGVEKIVKILKYLEVSADELFELTPKTETLTQEERNILEAYRQAEPGMQAAVRKLLDAPEPKSKLSTSTNGKKNI